MGKIHVVSQEAGWHMPTTDELVEAYKLFLEIKYPGHHKKFLERLAHNPEAARAEAVLFSVLRWSRLDPKISENLSTGGTDFLCHKDGPTFFLEVTSIGADAAANASEIPATIPDSPSPIWYKTITKRLHRTVCDKTLQLASKNLPCVLAITTEHHSGGALLGVQAAHDLLTGETKISIPVGGEGETSVVTEMKEAAFFRPKKGRPGEIEACRKGIAAILLVQIYPQECRVVGLLHPDPSNQFSIDLLPSVPFLRLRDWPPKDNKLRAEWVIADPEPARFHYQKVEFTTDELKRSHV